MHGILIRVSIIKKVPVYVALRQELKYLKKLDNKDSTHLIPYYKFYKIYNNCKNKKYIIKQANTTLAQRFKGISDSSYFYMKKNPYLFKKKITNYFDGILFLHDLKLRQIL